MSNIDRDDNDSTVPSDDEFAQQQAALALRRAQAMREMQEAEEQLLEQRRKRKEEKERERKAQEERETRERLEREKLERQRAEQERKEELERQRALAESRKAEDARQKAREPEVRKYLEGLESEALMKGKTFYPVQNVARKSVAKPSGAAAGSQPGSGIAPADLVTLRNSKGVTLTGVRNTPRCSFCEGGKRACATVPKEVSFAFVLLHASGLT
jgi:DNA polymerase II small subunit/DNA polymerase delta subunit B